MVSLLFLFGGHASNIEAADVMDNHATYDRSYFYSFLYVFTLTLPNATSAYRTFGGISRYNSNSFNMIANLVTVLANDCECYNSSMSVWFCVL